MACGTPVIGKVPNMKPEWMSDGNGVWTYESNNMVDIIAEYTQNWLEDNISESLYQTGIDTAKAYQDKDSFESEVTTSFDSYLTTRLEAFQTQLDKLKVEETV
jgi:glycosyltransferase involved in cell wall biosynthesis